LKPSTVASHAQLLRLYVLRRFGALQATAIERGQVKAFLGEWSAKGELSRNTLRLMLCTLCVRLNHAVEDGVIDHNPAEKLGRFTKTIKPQHQAQAMNRDEAEAFLASATELCPDYHPLFLMAFRAGLRKGELLAVKWGYIQFGTTEDDSNRYIFVQRNFVQGKFTTPKSKKSRRVDLSRELRRSLLELRDKRMLEAMMAGRASIADDFTIDDAKSVWEHRSDVAHGRDPWAARQNSPGLQRPSALTKKDETVRRYLCADQILRTTILRCLTDRKFAAMFVSDDSVNKFFPL